MENDDFKWFGEGFDGFPRRLPDDCVEYVIHAIDERLNTLSAVRDRITEIVKTSVQLQKRHLQDYIWQRDQFQLTLHPRIGLSSDPRGTKCPQPSTYSQQRPHLRGRSNVGDSVADEWLIVYLLFELSKACPDAWIRCYDTDGEFLLIEAAKALPKWLQPDMAEHRVWINNGHLRLIPVGKHSRHRSLSMEEALSFIREHPQELIISPVIEDEAFYRLREYPSAIAASLHHARVTIPRRLAFILRHHPAAISLAAEALYLRDPVSLKPLATKDIATLNFPPEDFVTVRAKFTKVGYAQLRSQVFEPPPAWTSVIPRMKDVVAKMGMKLTCGSEMMLGDKANQNTRIVREICIRLEDLEHGEEELPDDATIACWPQGQDDERWLEINYNDFENELSNLSGGRDKGSEAGFVDGNAQQNLRKMVSRFQDFLDDDKAGVDGVEDDDDHDSDDLSSTSSGDDEDAPLDEKAFERAVQETREMPGDQIEESGLLEEARKLAVEDAEGEDDLDEDEEMKQVMALMERELKGHGALNLNGKTSRARGSTEVPKSGKKPVFGPERPPHMTAGEPANGAESAAEETGVIDGELSSDEEDFNDVDLGLAANMLESFKGQVGTAGPAGNLLRQMGITLPRDEGEGGE